MIRGTDTAFKFHIPCSFFNIEWVAIKFWQDNNNGTESHPMPIMKDKESCSPAEAKTLVVTLSAEETARFLEDRKGYVQLLASNNGAVFGSKKIEFTVHPMDDALIEAWLSSEEE